MSENNTPKPEHECEHYLVTDVAVYGCECGNIQIVDCMSSYNANDFVPIAEITSLREENKLLREEIEELKRTRGAKIIINRTPPKIHLD